jgi:hypothetical protein
MSRPKNATPEMFYKKGETDMDYEEQIITGIDEDLGESDIDLAIEPVSKMEMKQSSHHSEKKSVEKKP